MRSFYAIAPEPAITGVAVEKGTKAVISANSGVYREQTFNDLQTNFIVEIR
jgi:hypothetical protein